MPSKPYKRDYIATNRNPGPGTARSHNVTPANNPSKGGASDSASPADPVKRIADGKGRNKRGN